MTTSNASAFARATCIAWVGALMSSVTAAHAAGLEVTPTSLHINPTQRAEGLWLSNAGRAPLRAQVRAFAWTQADHADLLAPTTAITVSPPMLQIAPGGQQLLRVIRTSTQPPQESQGRESAYRLIIDELPAPKEPPTEAASPPDTPPSTARAPQTVLEFLMRYSVPVFVGATSPSSPAPDLQWSVERSATTWTFTVRNPASVHAQIADLHAVTRNDTRLPLSKGLVGYVLAGQEMQWNVPVPESTQPIAGYEAMINRTRQAFHVGAP